MPIKCYQLFVLVSSHIWFLSRVFVCYLGRSDSLVAANKVGAGQFVCLTLIWSVKQGVFIVLAVQNGSHFVWIRPPSKFPQPRRCRESQYFRTIDLRFSRLDSEIAFCLIVLMYVFINGYRHTKSITFKLYNCFNITKKYSIKRAYYLLVLLCLPPKEDFLPTFQYFLVSRRSSTFFT